MVSPGYQRRHVVSTVEEMMHTNTAHASAGFIVVLERNYSPVSWFIRRTSEVSAASFPSSGGMAPASERGMYKYEVIGENKWKHPFREHVCTHLQGVSRSSHISQLFSPEVKLSTPIYTDESPVW